MNNTFNKQQLKSEFLLNFQNEVAVLNSAVATEKGDWVVKGFIDIAKVIKQRITKS